MPKRASSGVHKNKCQNASSTAELSSFLDFVAILCLNTIFLPVCRFDGSMRARVYFNQLIYFVLKTYIHVYLNPTQSENLDPRNH